MSVRTYQGSCHCGKVRLKAQIDLTKGTGKCNCTFCTKARWWGAMIKPEQFELLSGAGDVSDYTKGKPLDLTKGELPEPRSTHHFFCKTCGVRAFGMGHIPEIGGHFCTVNVACLDDVDFREVMKAPFQYFDGRTENWFQKPDFTDHL
jgi:hypothetical protein